MVSLPGFVREPEGVVPGGSSARKEGIWWVRTFARVAELAEALTEFGRTDNERWSIGRHGHRTPSRVRRDLVSGKGEAA